MKAVTFITGNEGKLKQLKNHIKMEIVHKALDLPEIQSMDLSEVARDKAERAYAIINSPVLVEDVSLKYHALGNLPGPLIKWFLKELGNKGLCRLINHYNKDRSATAEVIYDLFDGKEHKLFSSKIEGRIAAYPRGEHGFGWDPVFIPEGSKLTWAEESDPLKGSSGLREAAIKQIKDYLITI